MGLAWNVEFFSSDLCRRFAKKFFFRYLRTDSGNLALELRFPLES